MWKYKDESYQYWPLFRFYWCSGHLPRLSPAEDERSAVFTRYVFLTHVGGTRWVTSSPDHNLNRQAWITLTVEVIRTCIFICLCDGWIQGRETRTSRILTFFLLLQVCHPPPIRALPPKACTTPPFQKECERECSPSLRIKKSSPMSISSRRHGKIIPFCSVFLFFSFWRICCRCLTDFAPLNRLH